MRSAALIPLAALAVAAPTKLAKKAETPTQQYQSGFDDLQPVLLGAVDATEIGPYNGQLFDGINVITPGIGGTVPLGVRPESDANVGVYTSRNTALNGAVPRMTSQYPGSVIDYVWFQEFYFGCALATVATVASVAIPCEVNIQGYKSATQVAEQTFRFDPGTLPLGAVDMVRAILNDDFWAVDEVRFRTNYLGLDLVDNLGATLIDSLQYKAFQAPGKKYEIPAENGNTVVDPTFNDGDPTNDQDNENSGIGGGLLDGVLGGGDDATDDSGLGGLLGGLGGSN